MTTRRTLPLLILVLVLLMAPSAHAVLNNNVQIDVRPTVGSSVAGGGFDMSSAGTNMAIFNNKNAAGCSSCQSATINISSVIAVANGTTTITDAGANFSSAGGNNLVGNIVYFQGGTGAIAAVRRQVASVTNSTTIVLDAAIAASTGMTMNIGGALDLPATALLFNLGSMTICVKASGTIGITAGMTLNNAVTPGANSSRAAYNGLIAYTTTCGDHDPHTAPVVTIQISSGTGITMLTGVGGWWIDGFIFDCNSLGTSTGVLLTTNSVFSGSKIMNCTTRLFNANSNSNTIMYSEFTGCVAGCTAGAVNNGGQSTFDHIYIHDIGVTCMDFTGGAGGGSGVLKNSVIHTCIGTNVDGVLYDVVAAIYNNVIFNVTRYSMNNTGSAGSQDQADAIQNNIMMTAGTACMLTGAAQAIPQEDGNAYLNCGGTGGTTNILPALVSTGISFTYTRSHNIQLTADPFVASGSNNFALNSTAGGGAAVRGTWTPATIPGVTGTGYPDFGAFDAQAPSAANSAYVR